MGLDTSAVPDAPVDAQRRTLADQLVQAQVDKTRAETFKLEREAMAVDRQAKGLARAEVVKIVGALVLGAGGVLAAWTQFEVAELKAKAARQDLQTAERAQTQAQAATREAAARLQEARAQATRAEQDLASARRTKEEVDGRTREALARRDAAEREVRSLDARVLALQGEVKQRSAEAASSRQEAQTARSQLGDEVLKGLAPEAAAMAVRLIDQARGRGIELRLLAGYRSPAQQAELFAAGKTRLRLSTHNTGLAFDVVLIDGGKAVFEPGRYAAVGELGKGLGLVWGGDYKPFADPPHFETAGARQALARMQPDPAGP